MDPPIAADSVTYLDSAEWVASAPGQASIRASVPGDLITDLHAAGVIPEPLYELNWLNYSAVWDQNVWTFSRSFVVPSSVLAPSSSSSPSSMLLVFDGIKMPANVSLNGAIIGTTTDQFLRYIFPVSPALLRSSEEEGTNTLSVTFDSSQGSLALGRFSAESGGWD